MTIKTAGGESYSVTGQGQGTYNTVAGSAGLAHSVVDAAIGNGGMILMDGNITFDKSDMEHLKKLLDYNLQAQTVQHYAVKTSE